MYCPKCAAELVIRRDTLYCERGDMELSRHLRDELETVVDHTTSDSSRSDKLNKVKWGGEWFCPACGSPMAQNSNGHIRCSHCNRELTGKTLWELIEFHPHRNRESATQ